MNTTPITFSITTTGTNRLLVVCMLEDSVNALSSITFNGTNLIQCAGNPYSET